MTRCHPSANGTLLHGRPCAFSISTSMNVRWQFTSHQVHTVSFAVVLV